jgi:hypothetical protein
MSQALSGNEVSALGACMLPGNRRRILAYPAIQAPGSQVFFIGPETRENASIVEFFIPCR